MNPISHRYRTLGDLRRRLRARLGFMTQGPAAESNREALDDILQEAHAYVCEQVQVSVLRKKTAIRLSPGSFLYDWHNDEEDEDIDPGRVLSVWVAESDTLRSPLVQGITERHREFADSLRDAPSRYDTLSGQIELWPIPDRAYDLLIEYEAGPTRFAQDADRPSVPDELVFQLALATAKAHYRHADAQVAGEKFEVMLRKFKATQHEGRRYVAGQYEDVGFHVVRTADGYRLRG